MTWNARAGFVENANGDDILEMVGAGTQADIDRAAALSGQVIDLKAKLAEVETALSKTTMQLESAEQELDDKDAEMEADLEGAVGRSKVILDIVQQERDEAESECNQLRAELEQCRQGRAGK